MYYTCLTQRDMQGRKCQCNDAIGSLSSRLVMPTSGIMSVVMLRVPANASPAGIQVHLGLVSGRPLTSGG